MGGQGEIGDEVLLQISGRGVIIESEWQAETVCLKQQHHWSYFGKIVPDLQIAKEIPNWRIVVTINTRDSKKNKRGDRKETYQEEGYRLRNWWFKQHKMEQVRARNCKEINSITDLKHHEDTDSLLGITELDSSKIYCRKCICILSSANYWVSFERRFFTGDF